MNLILQSLLGAAGSAGFALLFNIRRSRLVWIGAGGALSWMLYCMLVPLCSIFAAMFIATGTVALLSELLARRLKTPVILLLVPMLIPLIPGRDLYAMMSALIQDQRALLASQIRLLALQAGAIASGILCLSTAINSMQGLRCGTARNGKKDARPWKT